LFQAQLLASVEPAAGALVQMVDVLNSIVQAGPNLLVITNTDFVNFSTRVTQFEIQDDDVIKGGLRELIYGSCHSFKIAIDIIFEAAKFEREGQRTDAA
ncbi:hypothetical protein PFISCL1PPCAC_27867, partial [Pristionchus fissidentatus]